MLVVGRLASAADIFEFKEHLWATINNNYYNNSGKYQIWDAFFEGIATGDTKQLTGLQLVAVMFSCETLGWPVENIADIIICWL